MWAGTTFRGSGYHVSCYALVSFNYQWWVIRACQGCSIKPGQRRNMGNTGGFISEFDPMKNLNKYNDVRCKLARCRFNIPLQYHCLGGLLRSQRLNERPLSMSMGCHHGYTKIWNELCHRPHIGPTLPQNKLYSDRIRMDLTVKWTTQHWDQTTYLDSKWTARGSSDSVHIVWQKKINEILQYLHPRGIK